MERLNSDEITFRIIRYITEMDGIFFKISFVQITTCMMSAVSILFIILTVKPL